LLAEGYRGWRASDIGRITDAIEQDVVLEMVGDVRGRQILDIGCGDGSLAVCLAQRGAIVTGVDPSEVMIKAARMRAERAGVDVTLCVGRAEALPFGLGTFDLVMAVTVLCFVRDPGRMFAEAGRVLASGGRFVIGELGRYSSWAVERRVRAWFGNALWQRATFRSARELRQHARAAGLATIAVRGAVFYPRLRLAARMMRKLDARLGRFTTCGAAFIALAATRP
jgi:ubiquinone/menaquinone biosynthesis C-methylase UbiE